VSAPQGEAKKAADRAYYLNNKERIKKRVREWESRNPERAAELKRKHAQSDHGREVNRIASERVRNREPGRASKWRAENREKHRPIREAYQATRRARAASAVPAWVDKKAIAKVYREAARLTFETGIPHDVDHIVPVISRFVCGLHVPWNLRAIPSAENRAKSNKLIDDLIYA